MVLFNPTSYYSSKIWKKESVSLMIWELKQILSYFIHMTAGASVK